MVRKGVIDKVVFSPGVPRFWFVLAGHPAQFEFLGGIGSAIWLDNAMITEDALLRALLLWKGVVVKLHYPDDLPSVCRKAEFFTP